MQLQPQLTVKVRPNNQIVITSGNYKARDKVVATSAYMESSLLGYISRECIESAVAVSQHFRRQLAKPKKPLPPLLDIIQKSQRPKPAPFSRLNKPKSFTKESGQKLRESGAAMSIACDGQHRRCREVTLTLPANTKEAFRALAANTNYAVNRLFQPIRRDWSTNALWFFVWEYQKRGALHLHIALYDDSEDECERMANVLIEQWHKVLVDVGDRANCCMFTAKQGDRCTIRSNHQNHTAPIEKDIACYFSKYAGKTESKNNWYCKAYPISRFWGSSKTIKAIVKANSAEFKCDSLSNSDLANENMTGIISDLLEKIKIVSIDSYDFEVSLKGSHKLNHYKNGRKILSSYDGRCIANGTRYTIYCVPEHLDKALDYVRNLQEVF